MGRHIRSRRLVVNADDFGRSTSINHAIIQAHREGILTSASLMVNGEAVEEAVALARENPKLGVGLHLTLVCGRSTLSPSEIPGLVDEEQEFSENAVHSGLAFFFRPSLRAQLEKEIAAQLQKFQSFGLTLDHVNGHLNLHLHPTVFSILMQHAARWKLRTMRLTRDPFCLNVRLASGRWFYRLSHALIFTLLSRRARPALQRHEIRHTQHVFGLLQNGRVDAAYVQQLLTRLPDGDSELYSHPSLDEFRFELDALIQPELREFLENEKIQLIRYQDL